MTPTTPRAQIVSARSRRHVLPGIACRQRTPEMDRHYGGLKTDCPATATSVVIHVDVAVEHPPMCEQHAREQVSRCLIGRCARPV
jgi:hypothetical protein